MLDLRPNCECCDADLPPDSKAARICSFECTFCADCAENRLGERCPNCGGELLRRPIRPADRLARFPASTKRVLKAGGCAAALLAVLGLGACADQKTAGGRVTTASAGAGGSELGAIYRGASTRYRAAPRGCPSPGLVTFHVMNGQFTYRLSGNVQFEVMANPDGTLSARAGDYVLSGTMTDQKIEGDVRNANCGFHILARRKF
jgi:hypothetical protein